jgi:metal-dependent amidase/aminoacylase/carboxypeptidase family protein
MRQIVDGICAAHDVAGRVRYETGFPPTINDAALVPGSAFWVALTEQVLARGAA